MPAIRGRRSQFLLLFLTAVYLIGAVRILPVFFLAPLGALLLISGPRTARELFWIALIVAALLAWFRLPNTLADQTVRASAAFFTGGFIALTLLRVRSLFERALLAVVFAALATVAWYLVYHLRFATLENELITQTWEVYRKVFPGLPAAMPAGGDLVGDSAASDPAGAYASMVILGAALFPTGLALSALLGARLAWSWYHRIAAVPLLPAAQPLRDFRFNDQLVWLLLLSLGVVLARPHSHTIWLVAVNVLAMVSSLYAVRGAAIVRTSLLLTSPFFIAVLLLIMLPLFPVVFFGAAFLGVADTWVDFRRRMAPPSGVP